VSALHYNEPTVVHLTPQDLNSRQHCFSGSLPEFSLFMHAGIDAKKKMLEEQTTKMVTEHFLSC
jgi:hypothetical protein